jgi:hypothetical protein
MREGILQPKQPTNQLCGETNKNRITEGEVDGSYKQEENNNMYRVQLERAAMFHLATELITENTDSKLASCKERKGNNITDNRDKKICYKTCKSGKC